MISSTMEQDHRVRMQIRRLKALSSFPRLQIIQALQVHTQGLCVLDLVKILAPLGQPTISHHLRILCEADLLWFHNTGRYHYYSVRPEILASLQADLMHLLVPARVSGRIEEQQVALAPAAPASTRHQ